MSKRRGCSGGEWGRHGSPRADTLGKQSHWLQEGFKYLQDLRDTKILLKITGLCKHWEVLWDISSGRFSGIFLREHAGDYPREHAGNYPGEHAGDDPGEHAGYDPGEHAGYDPGEHAGYDPGEHAGDDQGEHAGYDLGGMHDLIFQI